MFSSVSDGDAKEKLLKFREQRADRKKKERDREERWREREERVVSSRRWGKLKSRCDVLIYDAVMQPIPPVLYSTRYNRLQVAGCRAGRCGGSRACWGRGCC